MVAKASGVDNPPRVVTAGPISVDLTGHYATLNGRDLQLTRTEFDLLAHFVQNPRRVIGRTELLHVMRCHEYTPSERTVDAHIGNLRSKLGGDSKRAGYIQTAYGIGYRLLIEP